MIQLASVGHCAAQFLVQSTSSPLVLTESGKNAQLHQSTKKSNHEIALFQPSSKDFSNRRFWERVQRAVWTNLPKGTAIFSRGTLRNVASIPKAVEVGTTPAAQDPGPQKSPKQVACLIHPVTHPGRPHAPNGKPL